MNPRRKITAIDSVATGRSRSGVRFRVAAGVLALATIVAACGGGAGDSRAADSVPPALAETAPEGTTPETADDTGDPGDTDADNGETADETGAGAPVAPPDATIAPDVPDEFDGFIGPVEVRGEPLVGLPEGDDPAIGTAAPVIVGLDYGGTPVRIDAASDGPTMVVFVAHWCPHCNAEIPRLNELRDDGRLPDELNVIAVSTAINPAQPNFPPGDWLVERDWTYPVIADGVDMQQQVFIAANAFGVGGFPFTALIASDGSVADRWSGEREPDEIVAAISASLGI